MSQHPFQHYSNVGIMTRNQYAETYSTSASDRYANLMAGLGVTQAVFLRVQLFIVDRAGYPKEFRKASVAKNSPTPLAARSTEFLDSLRTPEGVKAKSYSRHQDHQGSREARSKLVAAVDTALDVARNKKAHCRFCAYTNADIADSHLP